MVSQNLLALITLLFLIKIYSIHAQCHVEYMTQPCTTPTTLSAASYVQPVSQFVMPAVIQPIQSDPYMGLIPPSIPDYSKFYNPISPVGAMPPIIFDNSNDSDGLDNLLYFLLFALKNKRNNGFRRNNGGCSCGGGCNSYSGNSCNCGNCNNCGGYGMSVGCSSNNGCSNCSAFTNGGVCGNCGGCEKCCTCRKYGGSGNCGSCNSGTNGCSSLSNSINSFPCGSNCIFIPFPIAIPIGNAFQSNNGSGCPIHGIETCGCCDDCQASNAQCPNEINLIFRTDC